MEMVKMIKDLILSNIFRLISFMIIFIVVSIFSLIIIDGARYFSFDFFTKYPSQGMTEGGILPAIVGSLIIIGLTFLFSVPIGIFTGIYLAEYDKNSKIKKIIDISITSLSGVPSIVYGLFGLAFFSVILGFETSIIAGSLTLSVMTLPIIASNVRETLYSLPKEIRESAYALGAKKTEVIFKVLIPTAKNRIVTSVLIGLGRVLGETAPILLTGAVFYSTRFPKNIFEPAMTLPTHIYYITVAYGKNAQWMAKGASSFLLILIIIIYLIAFSIRRKTNGK